MQQVSILETVDHICLNPDRMQQLHHQLGAQGAHKLVQRAIEDLALRLQAIAAAASGARWDELRKRGRALQAVADQIGLDTLIMVTDDVLACIDGDDPVALAATQARLQRIGHRSLGEIRRLLEQSG